MLQEETIRKYVIDALGKHRSRNDIIQNLCEHAQLTWPDAEKLVKQIEVKYGSEINAKQSPLIVAIGIASIIGGLALIAFGMIYLFIFLRSDPIQMARSSRGVIAAVGGLVTGCGLVSGAIVGMWKTIKDFFEDKENR